MISRPIKRHSLLNITWLTLKIPIEYCILFYHPNCFPLAHITRKQETKHFFSMAYIWRKLSLSRTVPSVSVPRLTPSFTDPTTWVWLMLQSNDICRTFIGSCNTNCINRIYNSSTGLALCPGTKRSIVPVIVSNR